MCHADSVSDGSIFYSRQVSSHSPSHHEYRSLKSSRLQQSLVLLGQSLILVFGFLIAMVMTAWSVRGLTLLIGRSKTNTVDRLADVPQAETLPLNEISREDERHDDSRRSSEATFDLDTIAEWVPQPTRAADASRIRGPGVDVSLSPPESSANILSEFHQARPPTKAQKVAAFVSAYIDVLTWSMLQLVGLSIYLGTGYAMPAQLPLNILTFFLAMRMSPSVRRFIHPIFPCAGFTILGIFALAAMKGESLDQGYFPERFLIAGLVEYRTQTPYIQYFFGPRRNLPPPGAGDILAAILDVSIVSLAIPMFNHRAELKRHVNS
jgi:LrgB-like family